MVGNNTYKHLVHLRHSINDANAMGSLLDRKGYDVTLLLDATSAAFRDQFCCFSESLCPGDTVVIHFSGHGLQQHGGSRLVFIDESVEVDDGEIRSVVLVFRIMCSNMRFPLAPRLLPHPCPHHTETSGKFAWEGVYYCLPRCFPRRRRPVVHCGRVYGIRGQVGYVLSGWSFFVKENIDVCIGFRYAARSTCVVIGFASESSMVSFESPGALSFYTDSLLHNIDVHGHRMDVSELLGLVRAEVARASNGAQTPCVYSASTGRVMLVSLVGSTPLSAAAAVAVGDAAVTVGDAVRPLLNHLFPQVSQYKFLRRLVSTLEQFLGEVWLAFCLDIVYNCIGFGAVI